MWALRGEILGAVDRAGSGSTVTVRVLPRGRRAFLTISGDGYSARYGADGRLL